MTQHWFAESFFLMKQDRYSSARNRALSQREEKIQGK